MSKKTEPKVRTTPSARSKGSSRAKPAATKSSSRARKPVKKATVPKETVPSKESSALKTLREEIQQLSAVVMEIVNKISTTEEKTPKEEAPEADTELPAVSSGVSGNTEEAPMGQTTSSADILVFPPTPGNDGDEEDTRPGSWASKVFTNGTPARGKAIGALGLTCIFSGLLMCILFVACQLTTQQTVTRLEVSIPEEIQLGEPCEIPISAPVVGIETFSGEKLPWTYSSGILSVVPEVEGDYICAIVAGTDRNLRLGTFQFSAKEVIDPEGYKELITITSRLITANVDADHRSVSTSLAEAFRQVAENLTLTTWEDMLNALHPKIQSILGFDKDTPETDHVFEAQWQKVLGQDAALPSVVAGYLPQDNNVREYRKILVAIAAGFERVQ